MSRCYKPCRRDGECDASASEYSYSAIFTNALYFTSDLSKEYKRGLQMMSSKAVMAGISSR